MTNPADPSAGTPTPEGMVTGTHPSECPKAYCHHKWHWSRCGQPMGYRGKAWNCTCESSIAVDGAGVAGKTPSPRPPEPDTPSAEPGADALAKARVLLGHEVCSTILPCSRCGDCRRVALALEEAGGRCVCGGIGEDGPDPECPQHGRSIAEWSAALRASEAALAEEHDRRMETVAALESMKQERDEWRERYRGLASLWDFPPSTEAK